MVPAPRIREVRTARELLGRCRLAEVVACAPRVAACCAAVDAAPQDIGKEYAIWFSPGQVSPMGHWVLRGDGRLNHEALTEATRRLVDRHPALRLQIVDPLRYLSFTFDVGVLFTLIGPLLERGPWLGRLLRRVLAGVLEKSCFDRKILLYTGVHNKMQTRSGIEAIFITGEMYAKRNEAQLPLDIIQQKEKHDNIEADNYPGESQHEEEFESTLKRRRYNLVPPTQITGYEVVCHLEGTWAYQRWDGQFAALSVIREAPPQLLCADAVSRRSSLQNWAEERERDCLSPEFMFGV
ncbi:Klp68D [Symbiodinium sp. KB8]|nr:Klp68D [Symbiodinium sp. KB8]